MDISEQLLCPSAIVLSSGICAAFLHVSYDVIIIAAAAESPATIIRFSLDGTSAAVVERGKQALQALQAKAGRGTCWTDATNALVNSCGRLTDLQRGKLALALAHCHLQASGLAVAPCDDGMSLLECTRPLLGNPIAFNTYTEFFVQAEHLCHYVQHEQQQGRLEALVTDLLGASQDAQRALVHISSSVESVEQRTVAVGQGLRRSLDLQQQQAVSMQRSFEVLQERTSDIGRALKEVAASAAALGMEQAGLAEMLLASRATHEQLVAEQARMGSAQRQLQLELGQALEGVRDRAEDAAAHVAALLQLQAEQVGAAHREVLVLSERAKEAATLQNGFLEALTRLSEFQAAVLGEFADLRAMAFYCAAVIVALLLTGCSARLAAARLPLFILVALSYAAERRLPGIFGVDLLSGWQLCWLVRRTYLVAGACALGWSWITFEDGGAVLQRAIAAQTTALQVLQMRLAGSGDRGERRRAEDDDISSCQEPPRGSSGSSRRRRAS